MKNKELTWEEIEIFLKKELSKTKHIMTWGTIGSKNIEHDIDTIITKKPSSKTSDFYREIHRVFDNLDNYLDKNFKSKIIRFAHSTEEPLIKEYINKKSISFHTMIYVSFPQIERDWGWTFYKNENTTDFLKENYNILYGKIDDLFKKDFQKENGHENLFIKLYLYDFLNSNLPEKLFLKIMNNSFEYLYRKRLGLEYSTAKNHEEVRKYFYKLCDILDELSKK